ADFASGNVTITASNNVIKVYYVKDDTQTKKLSYTVEYYKDGSKEDSATVTKEKTVWISDPDTLTVETVDTPAGKFPGYKFDHTVPTTFPATIADKGVIKVYYEKDDTQTLSYTVEYYKGTDPVPFAISDRMTVSAHTPSVSSVSYANKPTGYRRDASASTGLPFTVTTDNKVIKVYYVEDTVLNEGPIEIQHKYYLDQTTEEGIVGPQYRKAESGDPVDTLPWQAPIYSGKTYGYWKTEIWVKAPEPAKMMSAAALNADAGAASVLPSWLTKRVADLETALVGMTEEELAAAITAHESASDTLQKAFDDIIKTIKEKNPDMAEEDIIEVFENYKSTLKNSGSSDDTDSESAALLKDFISKLQLIKEKYSITKDIGAEKSADLSELSQNLDLVIKEMEKELDIKEETEEAEKAEKAEPEPAETVEPKPAETVEPKPDETVVPKPDETVVPKPDETVVPKPAETVEPKPAETVVPKPAETVVPKPAETVEPKPAETVVPKPAETVVPKPDETVVPKPDET
ncbi:hypothetical protein V6615_16590, partial [Oscillospiraceae bacterium PP1C4]